jgi:hypothetical protein
MLEGATGVRYDGVVYREVCDDDGPTRLKFMAYCREANGNPTLCPFLAMLRERYPDLSVEPGGARRMNHDSPRGNPSRFRRFGTRSRTEIFELLNPETRGKRWGDWRLILIAERRDFCGDWSVTVAVPR